MNLEYDFIYENSIKLGVSLLLGALMGAEREYKGRNIGFRTIILITLGSTLFTIISIVMGEDGDPTRIASNIVTGVGFLGAGAIFRDGFSVKGVTTASLIWISAAVGMSCGVGEYEFPHSHNLRNLLAIIPTSVSPATARAPGLKCLSDLNTGYYGYARCGRPR